MEFRNDTPRYLGLDFGDKTVGVAVSDGLNNLIAIPLETVRRDKEEAIKKTIARIRDIIREYSVVEIILGFPKAMDNSIGVREKKTIEFKERLNRNFKSIPVTLWDERLSTIAAQRGLAEIGEKENKLGIDAIAAMYILQNYLDYRNKC